MLNDQTLCALLVREEAMSAVQVANAFDVDQVDARDALNALVGVGDMVSASAVSPKGAPTLLYSLSDRFKKSKDYRKAADVRGVPALAPASSSGQAPAEKGAPPGRAERAVAFILARGRATNDELRAELGLRPNEYPSTWLSMPFQQGHVVRDGRIRLPGAGVPPKTIARRQASVNAASAASDAALAFRCAVWSDGMIELQRGGVRLAELRPDEARAVADLVRDIAGRGA
jgi:hypothetical protein